MPQPSAPDPVGLLQIIAALRAAKKRKPEKIAGKGTNEAGNKVPTNAPANAWPQDGDHD